MKVLVLYSTSGRKYHEREYQRIKQIVSEYSGVKLIDVGDSRSQKKKKYYRTTKRAIFEADAVIIDNTHSSFRLGHEATIAIMSQKPTLVLSQSLDMSDYIDHPHFFGAKYSKLTIREILERFLHTAARKKFTQRFNMFMSPEQDEFIEQEALREGISRSEYMRRLIDEKR